ncbi:MAG: hypothetical protein ACRDZ4_10945 [Egibacteraceae bacterium]
MSEPLERSDPAPGSVDWKAAEQHMLAPDPDEGAGEDETEAAEVKEFKYRGKTLKVDPEVYATLEDLRRDARGANGRLGSELARTRERLAKLEGVVSARPEAEDDIGVEQPDPMLATRDIAAWQRQYDAYHTAKMAKHAADIEKKYVSYVSEINSRVKQTQEENAWAERFYAGFDHLDHPDIKPIVAQVYTEHKEEIDAFGGDVESAHERLAELADARLVRLKDAGKNAGDNHNNNQRRPPRIESAAGPTPRRKVEDAPREFSASSWVAKQRLKMQGREPKKE